MRIYNALTRQVDDFAPLHGNAVTMYSCGPTVYDHAHIGNLASFIASDTLKRVLLASDYSVKHVMNFTDVDDKTIRRSREMYPDLDPMEALKKTTVYYESLFYKDFASLNIDCHLIEFVRATENIEQMQTLIVNLHQAGIAYVGDDGVYFSIGAYKKKGRVYGQLVEVTAESTGAARADNDEYDKDSIHDFALWKTQKEGEPAWPFELAGQDLTGRPGWHIECSAMSVSALGQPYDIHTGGIDLKFPHHENEIAQSTAANEDDLLARYFVHNEHLLVDGRKMSKSLGNFYTLEDIVKKGYDPLAFRLLVLQSHYRSQMNFTWEALDAAQNRLKVLRAFGALQWQIRPGKHSYGDSVRQDEVMSSIQNDLNTPKALSAFHGYAEHILPKSIFTSNEGEYREMLKTIDAILGLDLANQQDVSNEQKKLIAEREQTRKAKEWVKSDELRDKLVEQGIQLNDTDHGPIWSRS